MTKLLSKQETVIRILDDTEVATVESWDNGLRVMSKKVSIHDLLVNLLDMVETEDVCEFLHRHKLFEDGIQKVIENYGGVTPSVVLSLFLERVYREKDMPLIADLFKAIVEKFNMSEIEPESIAKILQLMLHRISNLEDPVSSDFNKLFLVLLEKVEISSASGDFVNQVLQMLLKRVKLEQDVAIFNKLFLVLLEKVEISSASGDFVNQVLKMSLNRAKLEQDVSILESMFEILSSKARPHWIQKVLAPYVGIKKIVKTPILPRNTVFYQEQMNGTQIVCLEIDRQRIDTIYHKDSYKSVGHPKMLFVFYVNGEKINTCKVYAVKDIRLTASTELYRFPFSNVFDNFSTCWPDLSGFHLKQLNQLETLPLLFLKSPSNDHLFRGKNLRELFSTLQDKDFNDSLLERTGLTFGDHFEMNKNVEDPAGIRVQQDEEFALDEDEEVLEELDDYEDEEE